MNPGSPVSMMLLIYTYEEHNECKKNKQLGENVFVMYQSQIYGLVHMFNL